MLSPREKYLFDVQGALVVPNVLSSDEVAALNNALDANQHLRSELEDETMDESALAGTPRLEYWNTMEWPKPWCEPFRDLVAHPRVRPYLDGLLGRGWHIDHVPEVFEFTPGAQGHAIHFGHHWIHPGVWYRTAGEQLRNGVVVVTFALTDQPAGNGGFCFIPGSHKSVFPRPDGLGTSEDTEILRNPEVRAGDAIIFTEGVAHGALPWRNQHNRRVAIFRYAAKTVQYGPGIHSVTFPDWVSELTDAQRAAFEPAHFYERPVIAADGLVTTVWDDYDRP